MEGGKSLAICSLFLVIFKKKQLFQAADCLGFKVGFFFLIIYEQISINIHEAESLYYCSVSFMRQNHHFIASILCSLLYYWWFIYMVLYIIDSLDGSIY